MSKDGYESEPPAHHDYFSSSSNEFYLNQQRQNQLQQQQQQPAYNSYVHERELEHQQREHEQEQLISSSYVQDESLPDVIKRSIAQAAMNDPVRMVQAPENFKQLHYTEHVSHTQMPPKAAMSLAAALEAEQSKGGRGALIFQKRKAKSEKWVVDDSNVKKTIGQQLQQQLQPLVQPAPPMTPQVVYEPRPEPPVNQEHYLLQQQQQQQNNKFSDFNAKPRGWGNLESNQISSVNYAKPAFVVREDQHAAQTSPPQQQHQPQNLDYNPNKLDLNNWNAQVSQPQQTSSKTFSISKDGIQNLKAKFYEQPKVNIVSNNDPKLFGNNNNNNTNAPQISKVKLNKLSSHENYLFNSKNALNALKISTNQYLNNNAVNNNNNDDDAFSNYTHSIHNNNDFDDALIASSDL